MTEPRIAFFHVHVDECDPVCVLRSFGADWNIEYAAERAIGAALDVERLARAIRKVENSDPAEWLERGDQADAIAAEYARLSQPGGSDAE